MAQPAPVTQWVVGKGRGFRPVLPFKPARRPGQPATTSQSSSVAPVNKSERSSDIKDIETGLSECSIQPRSQLADGATSRSQSSIKSTTDNTGVNANATRPNPSGALKSGMTKLQAKYSYKANPDSPLGQPEVTMKQGQNVVYLETFPENEMWWKIRTEEGQEGFVPASYVAVVSDKVSQLPWLAMKQTDEEAKLPAAKPKWKPYISAYNRDGTVTQQGQSNNEEYYCKVCDKQLNGPKPYGAHMVSKAHKEEVDLAKEKGEYSED